MNANSPFKPPRFTKVAGRKRRSVAQIRLTPAEQQAFVRLILRGDHARSGRLRAWAKALEAHLIGDDRIASDTYAWLTYRLKRGRSMLFSDAAKIYRAGLRVRNGELHTTYDWLVAVNSDVPAIVTFAYGYGIPGRCDGVFDKPFIPIMMPLEYIARLSEDLANVVVDRDERGRRSRKGNKIERFLKKKIDGGENGEVAWNFSAVFAVEQIVMGVLFRDYRRGCFGRPGENLYTAVNESAVSISTELRRVLSDREPRAFDRLFKRLSAATEEARASTVDEI